MSTAAATGSVFTGFWVDWTHDSAVLGSTLTLTAQKGAYLVAFLALWLRIVGGNFFGLLSYLLFRARSTTKPTDAVHHQHQAVLRNSNSDSRALFQFLIIGVTWRNQAQKPLLRSLSLAAFALVNIAAFGAAGILSSRIANANGDVLLRDTLCGGFALVQSSTNNGSVGPVAQASDDFGSYIKDSEMRAASYYENCYGSSPDEECEPLGRRWIRHNTTEIECPFDPKICANNTAIRLDSGHVDSHLDLGINSKKKDRLSIRLVSDCAPINQDGYRSDWLSPSNSNLSQILGDVYKSFEIPPDQDPASRFLLFNYGQTLDSITAFGNATNMTFVFSNTTLSHWRRPFLGSSEFPSYSLDAEEYFVGDSLDDAYPASSFWPIPEFNKSDGDISLHFLSSSTKYLNPVNDPWFLAAEPYVDYELDNQTFYVGKWPVNVVGCTNKIQTCIPATGKCTALASTLTTIGQWGPELGLYGDDSRQAQVGDRLNWYSLGSLMPALGSGYLLAQEYANDGISAALPDNQWVLEFQNWFGIMLAQMQQLLVEFVAGPTDPKFDKYVQSPPANRTWMCTAQIASRSGYLSFSVFPLAVLLILGAVIIFLNLFIEGLLGMASKKFGKIGPSSEWGLVSLLQLQRMAIRDFGKVEWSNFHGAVPLCGDERFAYSEEEKGFLLHEETRFPSTQQDVESTLCDNSPVESAEKDNMAVSSTKEEHNTTTPDGNGKKARKFFNKGVLSLLRSSREE